MLSPGEIVYWLRERYNRPGPPVRAERFLECFEDAVAPAGGPEPELLIVLTTYAREQSCAHVLRRLAESLGRCPTLTAQLLVLEDRSDGDYGSARELERELFGERLSWLKAKERLGKTGYWRAYQTALCMARALDPARVLFLQDDLQFEPTHVERIRELTGRLPPGPSVLYLFSSADDESAGRWIEYPRSDVPGLPLRKTQWFDLQAFVTSREVLELLSYQIIPVHPSRWQREPSRSSGVGMQLTRRLFGRADVYQCSPPLVFHGAESSQMNPEARAERALDNRELGRAGAK